MVGVRVAEVRAVMAAARVVEARVAVAEAMAAAARLADGRSGGSQCIAWKRALGCG